MKPLKRGANRTALENNLAELHHTNDEQDTLTDSQRAAIIGGALEETLRELNGSLDSAYKAAFWRYFNHNLWNLTRSLRASGALKDV